MGSNSKTFLAIKLFFGGLLWLTVESYPYKELFFDQLIDHYNVYWQHIKKETFKQRYLVQDKWWNRDAQGPIFFYTGNEGDITSFWDNSGFIFDIAPQFQALVVFAEHRYYGESLPFGELSFDHPYIDFLSAEQALADYAVLISSLKLANNASQSPVIAFGGSYGGMLSAYMRFRYPNIVAGSIAASAPILVVAGQSSREAFFHDVTELVDNPKTQEMNGAVAVVIVFKDFKNAQPGCVEHIKQAFSTISYLAAAGNEGLRNLTATFATCSPLQVGDYNHMVGWMRNAFTILAMMDYPYPTDFLSPLPANPVNVACQKISSSSGVLLGMSSIMDLVYGLNGPTKCHDIFLEYVECGDPTGCGTGPSSYAWDYQVCSEFIMPEGTNNITDMFPLLTFTLAERDAYCLKRWNIRPRNNWPAISFWGKDIKAASNIVFSNGVLDPWARGGILESLSDSLVAVLIEGGAHHLDLRGSNPNDPPSVIKARQLEVSYIQRWIKQAAVNA